MKYCKNTSKPAQSDIILKIGSKLFPSIIERHMSNGSLMHAQYKCFPPKEKSVLVCGTLSFQINPKLGHRQWLKGLGFSLYFCIQKGT